MSIIQRNSVELGKSPINNSPSKSTYSFSKSERFPITKPSVVCGKLYAPKDVWNYRSAGIGYGSKITFDGTRTVYY
jgi:hypothetical protein